MTKKYIHFDNRVVDYHFGIFENFNCTRGYQKLADKLELKHIRELGWLRTAGFFKSIENACWNARYDMKKGDDEKAKAFWEKRNNEVNQEWNEILKGDVNG